MKASEIQKQIINIGEGERNVQFDKTNKVIIDSMDRTEATAFVMFLKSEIARHQMDIDNAVDLIFQVVNKFKIKNVLEE